jgi:hypothetical protein
MWFINLFFLVENGARGKSYGGMTEELSEEDEEDDQMRMARGNGEDEELDMDVDARRRAGANNVRRPPSASGQRRQKPQSRRTYAEDDEDF